MSFGESFTLSNRAKIPAVGFGTWLSKPNEVGKAVSPWSVLGNKSDLVLQKVEVAVRSGYRHLDFAHIYENQKEVNKPFYAL